jgi:hypothetical protein
VQIGEPQVASEVEPIEDPVPRELEAEVEEAQTEELVAA